MNSDRRIELTVISECRVCGGKHLEKVFSLGEQYVATIFLKTREQAKYHTRYPLELVICGADKDEGCGFVQLKHTVSRDRLFETYWYRSGINQTMRNALAEIVSRIPLYTDLNDGDVVCDIGCNDGTLLGYYPKELKRIGVDPARNMAQFSRQHADEVVVDYFSSAAFFSTGMKRAKAVTSIAMFYSVVNPVAFARDVCKILDDNGVWILQMSSLPLMIENNCYDNNVHEHIGYYTVDVMERFLRQEGLFIVDGEVNDINAGSVRLFIKKRQQQPTAGLKEIYRAEQRTNFRDSSVYKQFARSVERETAKLADILTSYGSDNTCFYGASTKGNVILQHLQATEEQAFGIAERNPLKYGYFTLGSNLQIISEEEMRSRKPRNVIVLPYHFRSEIIDREAKLLEEGSQLIFPLPKYEVYTR